ncbi:MAG TPA: sulfatase-like hydrolase/transferase, partial [Agriterribacter sp.]|nr:sulfatase-like hydrolase/transferase [Agriterribacter sp.]
MDDLRPELGCYGKAHIKSPNIDRLAMSGVIFNNAFANYPVCGPSRASLLSGIYPGSKRFVIWNCSQDKDVPGIVSLP